MKIGVVCLHYKSKKNTLACLKALKISLKKKRYQIYLVNNNPGEKFEKESLGSRVKLIESEKNLGFAGGNNLGIKQALKDKCDYILLINNDALVYLDFFKPLLEVFRKKKKAGIVGPTIEHYQNDIKFYGHEGCIDWWKGICRHRNLQSPDKKLVKAEFVSGCCMLIKRSVFEIAGLLPAKYFLYLEDVDFCLKTSRAGFEIFLEPASVIYHKGSQSFNNPVEKLAYSFKSNFLFISRHFPWPNKLTAYIFIACYYPYLALLWTAVKWKRKLVG